MAVRKAVTRALSANMKDMKKGSKIMMRARDKMQAGRRELLAAERKWLKKAADLERKGETMDSPKLKKAASTHRQSAIGMTDKVLNSMRR